MEDTTDKRHTLPTKIEAGIHIPKGSCNSAMALWLGPFPIGTPQRLAMIDPQDEMEFAEAEAFAIALAHRYNSHDALVDYVKNTIAAIDAPYFDTKRKYAIRDAARALLSQLEAGK